MSARLLGAAALQIVPFRRSFITNLMKSSKGSLVRCVLTNWDGGRPPLAALVQTPAWGRAFHGSYDRYYGQLIEGSANFLTCPDFLPSISKEAGAAIFFATTQLTTYLTETIVDAYHHYAQV